MVKLADVAALAGVSAAAASRVLSGDVTVRVSDATRARVIEAARQLDYVPNHAARSLRTSRSGALALVVPDATSAVFAELASGAEEAAAERGMVIVLGRAESLEANRDWLRRMVGQSRVDGVILQLADSGGPTDLEELTRSGAPVVVINSVDDGPFSTIVLDDAAAIQVAVDHLRALGHARIGLIGGLPANATARRREAAFRASLVAAGLAPDDRWITDLGFTGADGRLAVDRLARRGPLPTGLVVANLNAALGALAELHARHARVPDDVSIVALHDVWYADSTWPPITTVRMPLRRLGSVAVTRAVDTGPATHTMVADPAPALIVRSSTTGPRAGD